MNFSIKRLPKSQIEISVEVSKESFGEYFNKAILELGKNIEAKGFRTGKVPKEIIESKLDKNRILQTAAQIAVEESYKKIVAQLANENKVEIISQPKVEVLKLALGNPFVFKCKVSILPEIDLPDYKKITSKIKKNDVSVKEKEVEDSLVFLQKSRAKFTPLQKPAQKEDFVEVEYESPQINSSKKITDKFVLGKGRFIPGFEEKLIGMKMGEEKEFTLPFPQNSFKKDLAGKEVDFKVKLVAVQKMELPEVNDEFARSLGEFKDLPSLKENVKEGLKKEKEAEETQRFYNKVLEEVAQNAKFETPEVLIEIERENLFKDLKEKINKNLKISFEEYLTSIKQSEKQFRESFQKEAEKRVKNFLVLKEIGKREKITVVEEEIVEEMNKALKNYKKTEIEKVDTPELKEYIKGVIYNKKVFQRLGTFSEKN